MDVTDTSSGIRGRSVPGDTIGAAGELAGSTAPSPGVDLNGGYRLAPDIRILRRGAGTVQVGLESPRSVLINDAPPGTADVLCGLDGHAPLAAAIAARGASPDVWQPVLDDLVRLGLLVPGTQTPVPPHLVPVRASLVHRHGCDLADRLLPRRADALVVVAGAGDVGAMTAELLAASGVGEVHLQPPRRGHRVGRDLIRTRDPAPQIPPAIVVLTDENADNQVMSSGLTLDLIPHLAVTTGVGRAVIGPLVLPGRSACLGCLDRIRRDLDPGRSTIVDDAVPTVSKPSPLLAAAASMLAAEQALDHVDGVDRPRAVDATLEWTAGNQTARRRTWYQHPECGCRELTR